ncbi:MAG: LysR family transcriptional regulator [Bacilli bacterium]|nr:LysR family transcriptional regulator [Bacilli bacterium]
MTIRHLKTFILVCDLESISKASEELHIAQPAVSQTISDLEDYYGITLFHRINRKLILTKEGNDLYKKAKEVIQSFNEFEEAAKNSRSHPSLKIGVSLTVASIFLPTIIKDLKKRCPNVRFTVQINNAFEIESDINNGKIDYAIIEGTPSNLKLSYEILAKNELSVVASKHYVIPAKLSLRDLDSYPLLLREIGSYSRNYLFNRLNISVSPFIEANSNQTIINNCLEGNGVAILPKILIEKYVHEGALKEIKLDGYDLEAETSLIWHKNKSFSNEIKKTIEICKNIIKGKESQR